jgi:hypothetical protein
MSCYLQLNITHISGLAKLINGNYSGAPTLALLQGLLLIIILVFGLSGWDLVAVMAADGYILVD